MICLLGGPADEELRRLAPALAARGVETILLSPSDLLRPASFTYRLNCRNATWSVQLADGRRVDGDAVDLVLNRLHALPGPATRSPVDAPYAAEEWRAAVTGWLRTLCCPVLNPPRAASPGGPELPTGVWRAAARAVGLAVVPWDSHDAVPPSGRQIAVTVLAGRCLPFKAVPDAVAQALATLSRSLGLPLLGARLAPDDGWRFLDGTPLPPVGEELVDGLVALAGGPP